MNVILEVANKVYSELEKVDSLWAETYEQFEEKGLHDTVVLSLCGTKIRSAMETTGAVATMAKLTEDYVRGQRNCEKPSKCRRRNLKT